MRKYFAIADLHGRLDLLQKALELIDPRRDLMTDHIVVLGDFVDRGPDSAGIIKLLRKRPDIKTLQGNHEDMMVRCARGLASLNWWVGNGGGATLESYGYKEGDPLFPHPSHLFEDLHWLSNLRHYMETEQQVFVHAGGLTRGKPVGEHDIDALQWHCFDRATNWEPGIHAEADYEKHIVHGHEQWENGPILLKSRTDLDTFAWLTGRLAIGVFDDTQGPPIEVLEVSGPRDPRYDT